MFIRVFAPIAVVSVAALSFLAPAWAATVTEVSGPAANSVAIGLQVGDFKNVWVDEHGQTKCGAGKSVINDGCSVVIKDDPDAKHAYGRRDPLGNYWIDTQDIAELEWSVTAPTAFTSLTFALTDVYDQPDSFFRLSYLDSGSWTGIWDIAERQENGTLYWLTVNFDQAVTSAKFLFSTKNGNVYDDYDGFGISSVSVAPVPLPPAALLLLGGGAMLAGLKRRRKIAA